MPIKFRCPHCHQFLGISRSKAGAVTDCPMCGRTLRVPNLDGTLSPLPAPQFNHGDTGLARALDALASLGNDSPISATEEETRSTRPVPIALAPAPPVEAVPIPIPALIDSPTPLPGSSPNSARQRDPLAELAASMSPSGSTTGSPTRHAHNRSPLLMIGAVCGLAGLLAGFVLGRTTAVRNVSAVPVHAPPTVPQTPVADIAAPTSQSAGALENAPASPTALNELQIALEGRITYVNSSGESRPDSGARILVIPARRTGTTKLSVTSFRAGTSDADLHVAQASIRALGGDFVLADVDGHYEVRLPASGKYHVLIASKYQRRAPDRDIDTAGASVLQVWFDQPRAFFGQTQSMLAEIQFDGQRSSIRDHVFPQAD